MSPQLHLPELSLVVLIGVTGSGKSTFAARAFGRYEVLSSDECRGMVVDDPNDQAATNDAFEILHFVAGKRLAAGRLTVVDATNVQREARAQLVNLARAHDVLPVAIVLDVPEAVCRQNNAIRADRDFGDEVIHRQAGQLRRSIRGLGREGFRRVHVLRSPAEVDAAVVVRDRLLTDFRDDRGPFDLIGDVHGCRAELEALLAELGYEVRRDDAGRPVDAEHPAGRRAVFVGDLVDRGPDSPGVLRLVLGMVANGHARCVPGNHEAKLVRALAGRKIRVSHGLEQTLAQLAHEPPEFRQQVHDFCLGLVSHLILDGGGLVVAHAGLKESYQGRASGRVRAFALYGDTTGETDEYGLPVRFPWATDYRGRATVVYGHTPVPEPEWINNTLCIDTGCVFGGRLTALRYPEKELVSVPALQEWYAPARPLRPAAPEAGGRGSAPGSEPPEETAGSPESGPASGSGLSAADRQRNPQQLDLRDVWGKRVVETAHGRVTIKEEQAAAALEVMSRFAIDPRELLYLPPTMAPCRTSDGADHLEHPQTAFATYRAWGVEQVMCQEKHMGSRAVVLLCRDDGVAAQRFGSTGLGAVHTRTGRSFFDDRLAAALLRRLRDAAEAAGLWQELATDWVLLDAELLPWSVKAEELLREQYASVGAAGRAALPAALAALEQAAARGIDVGDLRDRTRHRERNIDAFTAAYGRYCWPVDGLDGLALAPFQILATEGRTYAQRPHAEHLALIDAMVPHDQLLRSTRRLVVDTGDEASVAAGITWWLDLTGAGGEGMVVKPAANLTSTRKGPVQPGLKVRGREYLRIIYGPDYVDPGNLARLRERNVAHKQSLASREYALGLEALDRVARGEPLWRVHEAVFAVLALESEPIDPRL